MSILLRKSSERGYANHGWLQSFHTFSFAGYYDPKYINWGHLRVINEDRVQSYEGFDTHPHSNYEIYSYIVSGELTHKDSMKNEETINRGGIQFTSAGRGISHSEFNLHPTDTVHFLQIWVKPDTQNLKPSYTTRVFSDEYKTNRLVPFVASKEFIDKQWNKSDFSVDPILIHQNFVNYASILQKDKQLSHILKKNRLGYIQLIQTSTQASIEVSIDVQGKLETKVLAPGDGVFIKTDGNNDLPIHIKGLSSVNAEFLLFDSE